MSKLLAALEFRRWKDVAHGQIPRPIQTQLQALLDEGNDAAYGELLSIASTRLHKLTGKMLRDFPRLRRWEQTDDVFSDRCLETASVSLRGEAGSDIAFGNAQP